MNKGAFVVVCVAAGLAAGAAVHVGTRLPEPPHERTGIVAVTADTPADAVAAEPSGDGSGRRDTDSPSGPVRSYHEGIMRAAPSVVSVYAGLHERIAGGGNGGGPRPSVSQGSGVIVDPEGIVLTNLHLVEGADAINIVLGDGALHVGALVGSDRETDLAVVRIDAAGIPDGGLPAMRLDDAPPLRVGDIVLAIGNPFGVGQAVTQGIVSATRRRVAGGSAWQDFVQIDAAINPGNSGGALINPDGQLVGVTTAVFRGLEPDGIGRGPSLSDDRRTGRGTAQDTSGDLAGDPSGVARSGTGSGARTGAQGIGFAIPTELLARVVPEIIADGRVVRGWLGIGVDDLPMYPLLHRRHSRGAVVTGVLPGSPAALGGLSTGDVVKTVDGHAVEDATDLLLLVSSLAPGTRIRLGVDRDGESRSLVVSLDERPPPGE